MIYTFQKRKELNEMAEQRYPQTDFEWQRDGVPRMRCRVRPAVAEELCSIEQLESYAYHYWKLTRRPLPVFIALPGEDGSYYYDVNYVSHLSDWSLGAASVYIGEHRLYAEPFADTNP